MERAYTVSIRIFLALSFATAVFLAATRPVTIGEAILWDHLVRPSLRQAFQAADAWSGLLFAMVAKRAVGLFRLSEFSLRLPAIFSCGIFLIAVSRIVPRRLWPLLVLAVAIPTGLGWFSVADGRGMALAFCSLAVLLPRFAALFFGLAVVASPWFAIPLGVVALWRGIAVVERVAIPAATIAFILLILPLSHGVASSGPKLLPSGSREEAAVKNAVQPLRLGTAPIRISTASSVLPLVEFYRARYRQRNWEITDRDPQYRIEP